MFKKFHNQSGMVLVLAILIIAAVVAAAVIFNNLIIREIQRSRLIDQSMQAYYLAESGAERALNQIRRREAISDCDLVDAGACANNGYCNDSDPANSIPCVNEDEQTLNQGSLRVRSGWEVAASTIQETSVFLRKGESFQIDLFNPYQTFGSNINEIGISSDRTNLELYAEFTNLTKILGVGGTACADEPPVFKGRFETDANGLAGISNLSGETLLTDCSYAFRLNYPIDNFEGESLIAITVHNKDTGEQLDIPSRLIIDSGATFGKSRQEVRVRTPMRPPVSGLYDFVLFSEREIRKLE